MWTTTLAATIKFKKPKFHFGDNVWRMNWIGIFLPSHTNAPEFKFDLKSNMIGNSIHVWLNFWKFNQIGFVKQLSYIHVRRQSACVNARRYRIIPSQNSTPRCCCWFISLSQSLISSFYVYFIRNIWNVAKGNQWLKIQEFDLHTHTHGRRMRQSRDENYLDANTSGTIDWRGYIIVFWSSSSSSSSYLCMCVKYIKLKCYYRCIQPYKSNGWKEISEYSHDLISFTAVAVWSADL